MIDTHGRRDSDICQNSAITDTDAQIYSCRVGIMEFLARFLSQSRVKVRRGQPHTQSVTPSGAAPDRDLRPTPRGPRSQRTKSQTGQPWLWLW